MLLSCRLTAIALIATVTLCCSVVAPAAASAETGTAYVAALDIQSLPYGEYEWQDARRMMEERYAALVARGAIDHGIVWSEVYQSGGSTPVGMMLNTLLFGATREEAQSLLDAASTARNTTNPGLLEAVVFDVDQLKLPDTGMVVDKGGTLQSVNNVLVYIPAATKSWDAERMLHDWYLAKFGKEADFNVGGFPGNGRSINYREKVEANPPQYSYTLNADTMPPERKRSYNAMVMQSSWPTADPAQPWFIGDLPIKPLLAGHEWVKGYQVTLMRFDAASDETVAKLRADAAEFIRRVREHYPGIAAVTADRGTNMTPPYFVGGHLSQPSMSLLLATDDLALLDRIGSELAAEAAAGTGYPRIMWVRAGLRCVFLDEAAISGHRSGNADPLRVVSGSFVFPLWVDMEQAQAEVVNWRDQWIELYRQSEHPTNLF